MAMIGNEIMPKLCSTYFCNICDYTTIKKSSYDKHLVSAKHKMAMIGNEIMPKLCPKYTCEKCKKYYKDYSGLWRHNKKCTKKNIEEKEELIHF
jgi:hypothetical protein